MVSDTGGLYMAAEHLLDLYFAVRILLVFEPTQSKKRIIGIWFVYIDQRGHLCGNAGKQGVIWCSVFDRDKYAFVNTIGAYT